MSFKKGFTLIELLVVVAIIGILASVVLASLNNARGKGNNAAIKANLRNTTAQAELFYYTNTVAINTYTNVCTNGAVGGAQGIGAQVQAATKAAGIAGVFTNDAIGTATTATCNDSANAWAVEVPLSTAAGVNQMWCVDSTGKSKQETGTSLATATTYTCN